MSFRYTWVLTILFIQLIFWVYFIIKRQKQPQGLFSSAMDKITNGIIKLSQSVDRFAKSKAWGMIVSSIEFLVNK